MKKKMQVIILLIICALLVVVPLIVIKDSEFGGADGMAMDVVEKIDPNYVPWFENLIEPPGAETEGLLFALQASIGTGVIGFGFGYLVARKKLIKGE